ncbi:YbaN family protein [Acidovorax sp. Leaf160]|uniref:YbaN family protein n=1 Tax=Acidovorax sp. Leaf160 TaxID=1736280 RepID=UPI000701E341|nr:YbaN family protein [Acidovorax sp. Leaf160]KQR56142.1 hypothetical protein ASF94_19095 [Acidovorax sp. Leaf160]
MPAPHQPPPQQQLPPPPPHAPLPLVVRWLLLAFAGLCLVMGVVGIFVPGLPTTVFILMAGWAAARSSPRLHAWLWRHPLFGSMLRNWANGGCVSRRAKWSATALMALCAVVLVVSNAPRWAAVTASLCMACVLAWLWRRPEPR